ncbi:MAG: sortase [Oscillospiraceae bacterium]|nr:sortase [Oscillospiraceae bacterium]
MRKKLGIVCMILSVVFLAGALTLFLWNQDQANEAERASMAVIPLLKEAIAQGEEEPGTPTEPILQEKTQMTEVEIDGYHYIGYVSIPAHTLELPVMSQWDHTRLEIAPCRFSGTTMEENLVVIGHSYRRHFAALNQLRVGDEVRFTDMDGVTTLYQVEAVDVVLPSAVEEVTAGFFDLALVTCTYSGGTRVVVYCDAQ